MLHAAYSVEGWTYQEEDCIYDEIAEVNYHECVVWELLLDCFDRATDGGHRPDEYVVDEDDQDFLAEEVEEISRSKKGEEHEPNHVNCHADADIKH